MPSARSCRHSEVGPPNTIVYFISDNGLMLGEHRIPSGKVVPYEESARVPMVVRNPLVPSASHPVLSHALVENVDIAPTIAEQAGITWHADGRSLTPLLDGSAKTIRGTALIEACTKDTGAACWTPGLDTQKPRYFGMETNRYKYVEYQTGERELYDLTVDPYELVNHAGTAGWESTQTILANLLANLTAVPVPDTTIVTGPSGVVIPGPKTFTYFSQAFASTYRCRLSTAASPGQWAPCNGGRLTTGSLGDGMYTFSVQGTDSGGTDATPATRSFTVDSTAPIVVVGNGANKVIGGKRFSAFKITLFRASSHAVSVEYATSDFVAQSPSDFTAQAGVVTIPAGSLSTFVNVAIAAGATPNETFHLRLRSPVGATLGNELATGNTGAP